MDHALFDEVLLQIQGLVGEDLVAYSNEVLDDISEGYFEQDDVEGALVCGAIRRAECDEYRQAIDGRKYTVEGLSPAGILFEVVCKVTRHGRGRRLLIVTAYPRS